MGNSIQRDRRSGRRLPLGDHPLYTTSENLTSLLQEKRFLLPIFEQLVDYGLKECRLVCRKWRDASRHFPIELKSKSDEQLRLISGFPNTTSLTADHHPRAMSDKELFWRLARLTNLKSLVFTVDSAQLDRNMKPHIQSMAKLTDLSITTFNVHDHNGAAIASLKYLTNLTRLALHSWSLKLRMKPLAELQNIQALDIDTYNLFNERGECMFPSLTKLTYLRLTHSCLDMLALPVRSFGVCLQSIALLVFTRF